MILLIMSKTIQCKFNVSSKYINTDTEEIVDVFIPEGTTEEGEESIIREWYEGWVWENIDGFYERVED